ncbi:MAG: biopolymer transporter ExbD [Bdellovibrionales bacterium]|nr:biopolymer transporter ExbD [Bdellovibrionales bacterium]
MAGSNKSHDQDDIVADINMTPLIDIMLVLLIIFMVSSSAAIESGLDVNLPEANAVSDKSDAILVVSLSKTGDVAIMGTLIKPEELKDKIAEGLIELKTESVILEGDGESSLSKAMEVMDIAKTAGAKTFSIAAKLKDQ